MTFIAGLRRTGLVAPWVLEGAMDGDAFKTYTAEILAPTLAPGDIVVMDTLPAHKVAGIAQTIAKKKAQLFYLPSYSPDMNPIEMAFSKLKTALRAKPARTIDTLWRRIGTILDSFSPKDGANYFTAARYQHSI
jgi:transposase